MVVVGSPIAVIVPGVTVADVVVEPLQHNNTVPDILLSGSVGGVKLLT